MHYNLPVAPGNRIPMSTALEQLSFYHGLFELWTVLRLSLAFLFPGALFGKVSGDIEGDMILLRSNLRSPRSNEVLLVTLGCFEYLAWFSCLSGWFCAT